MGITTTSIAQTKHFHFHQIPFGKWFYGTHHAQKVLVKRTITDNVIILGALDRTEGPDITLIVKSSYRQYEILYDAREVGKFDISVALL